MNLSQEKPLSLDDKVLTHPYAPLPVGFGVTCDGLYQAFVGHVRVGGHTKSEAQARRNAKLAYEGAEAALRAVINE